MKKILMLLFFAGNALGFWQHGSFTVGTGGDFYNLSNAYQNQNSSAGMDGNCTLTVISHLKDTTQTSWTNKYNGYTILIRSSNPCKGNPSGGWIDNLYYTANNYWLRFSCPSGAAGTLILDGLNIKQCAVSSSTYATIQIFDPGNGIAHNLIIRNCIINKNGNPGMIFGSYSAGATVISFTLYNNKFIAKNDALYIASIATQPPTASIFENNTFIGGAKGIDCGNFNFKMNNNFTARTSAGYYATASLGTFTKCASTDNTGSAASLRSLSAATYFVDTAITSDTNFYKIRGAISDSGATPIIATNTIGCRNNPRPHYAAGSAYYSVGADEFGNPCSLPSISSISQVKGMKYSLTGSNLYVDSPTVAVVTVGGVQATVTSQTSTTINYTIASNTGTGSQGVIVTTVCGGASSSVNQYIAPYVFWLSGWVDSRAAGLPLYNGSTGDTNSQSWPYIQRYLDTSLCQIWHWDNWAISAKTSRYAIDVLPYYYTHGQPIAKRFYYYGFTNDILISNLPIDSELVRINCIKDTLALHGNEMHFSFIQPLTVSHDEKVKRYNSFYYKWCLDNHIPLSDGYHTIGDTAQARSGRPDSLFWGTSTDSIHWNISGYSEIAKDIIREKIPTQLKWAYDTRDSGFGHIGWKWAYRQGGSSISGSNLLLDSLTTADLTVECVRHLTTDSIFKIIQLSTLLDSGLCELYIRDSIKDFPRNNTSLLWRKVVNNIDTVKHDFMQIRIKSLSNSTSVKQLSFIYNDSRSSNLNWLILGGLGAFGFSAFAFRAFRRR
jgi:hypothetical protein